MPSSEVRVFAVMRQTGSCAAMRLSGRLSLGDLRHMRANLERLAADQRVIRLLLRLEEFDGWGVEAVPPELRLDVTFGPLVEVIAVVGDAPWQRVMTDVMKSLAHGEVQYFEAEEEEQAWRWLLTS